MPSTATINQKIIVYFRGKIKVKISQKWKATL
jgi:hypothetical protein